MLKDLFDELDEFDELNEEFIEEDDDYCLYVKSLVDDGYVDYEGRPCKCHNCGSKHLEECNVMTDGYNLPAGLIEEYDVCCSECGEIVAHYSYGGWEY